MDEFLKYWFGGLQKAIENMPETERVSLFCKCGKACSESYTKALYHDIWKEARSCYEFFELLSSRVKEIEIKEIEKNKSYEIMYHKCLCDLYTKGYMTTGCLCECSKQSLLYNLKSIWSDKVIEVELVESILRGGRQCMLRVYLMEMIV